LAAPFCPIGSINIFSIIPFQFVVTIDGLLTQLKACWPQNTVWTVDFEMPACTLYLLVISANLQKKKIKVPLPAGVTRSAAHTVCPKIEWQHGRVG
jgi:hypothetical protein